MTSNKQNIILNIDEIDFQYIYILEPIKNTIIPDGEFRRIIYSTEYMTLNNIIIHLKYLMQKFKNIIKSTNAF